MLASGQTSASQISSILSEASSGSFPARSSDLSQLSSSLSTALSGKTLSTQQASLISTALASAANTDGLSKDDIAAQKSALQSSLKISDATQEQIDKVSSAFDKVVSDQQQANLQKLSGDLKSLQSGSDVTQDEVKALQSSLSAMCDGATKPSQESVNKLGTDLSSALDDGNLSNKEMAQLTYDLDAVLNSANIPMDEFTAVVNDAEAILKSTNVSPSDLQTIKADCQAIYASLNPPAAPTGSQASSADAAAAPVSASSRRLPARR